MISGCRGRESDVILWSLSGEPALTGHAASHIRTVGGPCVLPYLPFQFKLRLNIVSIKPFFWMSACLISLYYYMNHSNARVIGVKGSGMNAQMMWLISKRNRREIRWFLDEACSCGYVKPFP